MTSNQIGFISGNWHFCLFYYSYAACVLEWTQRPYHLS